MTIRFISNKLIAAICGCIHKYQGEKTQVLRLLADSELNFSCNTDKIIFCDTWEKLAKKLKLEKMKKNVAFMIAMTIE